MHFAPARRDQPHARTLNVALLDVPDGNVWTANLEVPTGTELEYKVVHVHPHGVRWESIDNRVLTISAAADMLQQAPQDGSAASRAGVTVLDASGTEQAGCLTAMDVVCAWDYPAPLEIGINVDPQADTREPLSPTTDTAASSSSSSQLESAEGTSEEGPDGMNSKLESIPADVAPAVDSSSSHLDGRQGSPEKVLHGDDAEQLSNPASMQTPESQEREAALDPARAGLPENPTAATLQQTQLSDQVYSSSGREVPHQQVPSTACFLHCTPCAGPVS